tara:strand:- start:6824 stop:7693 length:870 start_codon:yes stop_codon:yes gene_type:complete
MTASYRTIFLMLGFVITWTATETIVGTLLDRYPPFQVVWLHYLTLLLIWVAIIGVRAPRTLLRTQKPVTQILRAVFLLLMPVSWAFALRSGFGHTVNAAFWAAPILVILFSALLLRERPSLVTFLAATAGSIAAVLIYAQGPIPVGFAWFAVLAMPVSFSLFLVLSRSLRSETIMANLFYLTAGIVIILTPFIPFMWVALELQHILHFAVTGVLGLLALSLLNRAAFEASLAPTAPLLLVPVPLAVLASWLTNNGGYNSYSFLLLATICVACAIPLITALNARLKRNNP